MPEKHRFALFGRIALVIAMLALSCQTQTPIGPMRTTMSAPDLEYLPPAQVRSAMWVLAAEVQYLERVMTDPTAAERNAMQAVVQGTLERMYGAARTLDRPGVSSQQHVINQNLGRFLNLLERAKRAADRDPPNYFPASGIAGSCSLCHGRQEGTAWIESERPRFQALADLNHGD